MSKHHLILVPGLMCDATVWAHQARQLETATTIAIPDHGSIDSLGKMAEAILKTAPARFAIAGHSMGGRVALEVFRRAPDRIEGMALMDTAYAPRPAGAPGEAEASQRYALLDIARKEGTRAMGKVWVQNMVHPDRLSDTALLNSILDMFSRKTPDVFAAQIKALLERPDATPLLTEIHCPTMVLCGRQDAWSTLSGHKEIAARIAHSELVVIEDCGHMSTMERPEHVTAAMNAWLTFLSV
jgi:pimeloyl-ACP methyl ester carboxylesterase